MYIVYLVFVLICVVIIILLSVSIYTNNKLLKFFSIGGLVAIIGIFVWSRMIISSNDWWYGTETVIYPIDNRHFE